MILGVGIDLVETERLEAAMARHDGRFTLRIFLPSERAYCESTVRASEHFAARFAAKEAAWKALGLSGGLPWQEIEVTRHDSGAPSLVLHGETKTRAEARGIVRLHLSLSHVRGFATAMVVAEGGA